VTAHRVPTYVYRVDPEVLPAELDGLEVLVRDVPDDVPEVCIRPSVAGYAIRVWGPPLELVRAER